MFYPTLDAFKNQERYKLRGSIKNNQLSTGRTKRVFVPQTPYIPIKTHISGALRERRLALAGRGNSVSPSVESHPHVSPPVTPPETFLPDRHKPSKIGTKGDRLLAPPKDTKSDRDHKPSTKTQNSTDTSHQKDTRRDRHKPSKRHKTRQTQKKLNKDTKRRHRHKKATDTKPQQIHEHEKATTRKSQLPR